MKILFYGDSITDMGRHRNEITGEAENPAFKMGVGYANLITAELSYQYPGEYEFLNDVPKNIVFNAPKKPEATKTKEQRLEDLRIEVFTNKAIVIKAEDIRRANDILAPHEEVLLQMAQKQNANAPAKRIAIMIRI